MENGDKASESVLKCLEIFGSPYYASQSNQKRKPVNHNRVELLSGYLDTTKAGSELVQVKLCGLLMYNMVMSVEMS